MEDIKKVYKDIKAYKSVGAMNILYIIIGGIALFACIFFIVLTIRVNLLYLIGAATTGLFGLWLLGMFIKKRTFPDLILKQQDECLYLFPDTDNQVILPLIDIVGVSKKNSSIVLCSGQRTIISKTNRYSLSISSLDAIYTSLGENIKKGSKNV